jgi:hypothetical protein
VVGVLINVMMQDLEKGVVPNEERPTKLKELWELCGKHKSIPDSMKLQGYDDGSVETKEFNGPYLVYQSEFNGGKVAVKLIRLHIPQTFDECFSVSAVSCAPSS